MGRTRALLFAVCAAAFVVGTAHADPNPPPSASVPEPKGLWHGPLHGQTPATLAGAKVIDAAEVERLVKAHAILIDVANMDRRPPSQSPDMPWTPIHRSIPGATWMPGAGSGSEDAAFTKAFDDRIELLTHGDKDKPVLAFCHPARWGSWNAAKRMTQMGYRHVYWFPQGAEGWQDHSKPADAEPDTTWMSKLKQLEASGFNPAVANPGAQSVR